MKIENICWKLNVGSRKLILHKTCKIRLFNDLSLNTKIGLRCLRPRKLQVFALTPDCSVTLVRNFHAKAVLISILTASHRTFVGVPSSFSPFRFIFITDFNCIRSLVSACPFSLDSLSKLRPRDFLPFVRYLLSSLHSRVWTFSSIFIPHSFIASFRSKSTQPPKNLSTCELQIRLNVTCFRNVNLWTLFLRNLPYLAFFYPFGTTVVFQTVTATSGNDENIIIR